MDISSININFNIHHFKSHIEEQPTHQNGWSLEYDGPVHKKAKGIISFLYFSKPPPLKIVQ